MFRPLLSVSVLLMVACGNESRNDRGPTHVSDLPPLQYVEVRRLGSLEDPTIGFSRIGGVAADQNGRVYVLERQSREVRVFGPDGQYLGTRGGPGQGPGEFTVPIAIGLLGDTLWVRDASRQRISWFDADGSLVHETQGTAIPVATEVPGLSIRVVIGDPLSDGLVGSSYMLVLADGAADRPYYVPVVRFDREGTVVDTVRWDTIDPGPVVRVGGRAVLAPRLQPQSPVIRRQGDERIEARWSDGDGVIDLVRVSANNDTIAERSLRYDPVPTPEHVRDSLLSRPEGVGSVFGVSDDAFDAAMASGLQLPAYLPPFRSIHVAADSGIWLELEGVSAESSEWLVLDPELTPRGRAALPARMTPQYINGPTLWMVELDDFDVPWLVLLNPA